MTDFVVINKKNGIQTKRTHNYNNGLATSKVVIFVPLLNPYNNYHSFDSQNVEYNFVAHQSGKIENHFLAKLYRASVTSSPSFFLAHLKQHWLG